MKKKRSRKQFHSESIQFKGDFGSSPGSISTPNLLLTEKYAPQFTVLHISLQRDLLTSKRKISELREILEDPNIQFILIQGPPGCGKHCTLRVLCKELSLIVESSSNTEGFLMKSVSEQSTDEDPTGIYTKDIKEVNKFMSQLTLANRSFQ